MVTSGLVLGIGVAIPGSLHRMRVNGLAGPINREMRHLISSLQNHNHQLKGDLQRYKRKLRETQAEINKVCSLTCGPVPACISVLFIYCVCVWNPVDM